MARRRRKKNATSKVALEFVESPARGPSNIPSPVYCNDDPPTASVVPIEEGINFSWVSPQFRHPLSHLKRRRHARAQGGNTFNSRTGQLMGKENSMQPPAHGRKITQKFSTLKFVGAEHLPTVNCDKSDTEVDTSNGGHTEIFHTPVSRRVTRSRSNGLNNYSDGTTDVGDSSVAPSRAHPTNLIDTRCQIPSGVSPETGCDVDGSIHIATSDGYSNACNSPLYETQQRPKTRSTRQSTRRLFSTEIPPHLSEHATSLLGSLDNTVDDNETEEPSCDNSVNTPLLIPHGFHGPDRGRTRRTANPCWLFTETPIKDASTCMQPNSW